MTLHDEYLEKFGNNADLAAVNFACDLMHSDAATFKQGYSRENAIIAAAHMFPEVFRAILEQEVPADESF